jgi:beta-lactam-binding protein with PASTA domain
VIALSCIVVVFISPTACSSNTVTVTQTGGSEGIGTGETGTVPDVVGMDLQSAQDTLQAHGFYNLGSHDVTGQSSFQILDRDWLVVDQDPPSGAVIHTSNRVELGVKRR